MKKLLLLLTFTFIFTAYLFSETPKVEDENLPHYIGAAAGFSTGYGLSYRYWPGDLGLQVVFTPIATSEDLMFNLGTAGFKTLHETKYTRLFLYLAANGTYANGEETIWADEEPYEEISSKRVDSFEFATGIGPGLEIYLFKNIVIDLMFGFKFGLGGYDSGLGFSAEGGIYYRF